MVGIGKTTYLERIQKQLVNEKKVIVAKSLSVEKSKTNLTTLITALFYDVSGDKYSCRIEIYYNAVFADGLKRI